MPPILETEYQKAQMPAPENKNWFLCHPFMTGISVVALMCGLGLMIVKARMPVSETTRPDATWGSAGGFALFSNNTADETHSSNDRTDTENLLKEQMNRNSPDIAIPLLRQGTAQTETGIDWAALLSQLSGKNSNSVKPQHDSTDTPLNVYSYIPQGLISTASGEAERTEAQRALYEYGNSVGSFVQGFDDLHKNMIIVLTDVIHDRGNPDKVAAAAQIGKDYVQLGKDIENIDSVPENAQGIHSSLAQAYIEVGNKLETQARAVTDKELLNAVEIYNSAANDWTKKFLALVTLFEVSNVRFGPTDPGRIFMFNAGFAL